MSDDQRKAEAEFGRRHRHADGSIHPAWAAGLHPLRQWPGVRRRGGARLNISRRRKDGLHRTGITVEKRLLRELQRQAQGLISQPRGLLQPEKGSDRDRGMAKTLHHCQAAQRPWIHPWIQIAGTGEHRHGGPETVNALKMKIHFAGADQ